MNDDPRLAEVRARLEDAVAALPGEAATPQELYDRYEMVAIEILDSEYLSYPEGELERYLREYLVERRRELGLDDNG